MKANPEPKTEEEQRFYEVKCRDHPHSKLDVFYDRKNKAMLTCCGYCERVLVTQPLP